MSTTHPLKFAILFIYEKHCMEWACKSPWLTSLSLPWLRYLRIDSYLGIYSQVPSSKAYV